MWKQKVNNKIATGSLLLVLLVSTLFIYAAHALYKNAENQELRAYALQAAIVPKKDFFKDIILEAQAVYVYDINSKQVLFQKNADIPLPLASITKVMTSLVAAEHESGNSTITIDAASLETEGDSGLKEGEVWNINDLLSYTLISSSNDGATAISHAFPGFIDLMNAKAQQLGLASLTFKNPTGLDIDETNETGGYGSAKDVAMLFEYALKNHSDLLEPTQYHAKEYSSDTLAHEAKNTNTIIGTIPNLLASKTGYTLKAGGNLGVIFDRGLNQPVVAVVLGSSYDGRFSDIQRLASSTLATYNESQ